MNRRKKRQQNDLLTFFGGLAMVVAGLYWLTSKVSVSSSFFGGTISLGRFNINSGLIVVPFIACIVWLFVNPDSFPAKVCVVLSVILIIASIIANTQLHMRPTSLYEYLLMLIFIFGGGGMVMKVLTNPKYRDNDDDDSYENHAKSTDYSKELDDLKKKNRK